MSATAVAAGGTSVRSNVAVKLLDLSDKGAGLVTTGRLRAGAEVLVRLFIEGTEDLYAAKALVRWAETWSKNGREADVAGIEFMEVQEVRGRRFRSLASWAGDLPTPGGEKRQNKRRLIESSKVTCQATGLFDLLGMSSNIATGLLDLSEGGCQVLTVKKLEPGTKVRLSFKFQNPGVEFNAVGEVRWCNRDTMSLTPRCATGVEFGDLSHDAEGRLRIVLKAMDAVER